MLERYAARGVVLRKTAPRCEVEFLRFAELSEIALEPRALGKEPENTMLIENIDLVFPDHVINGRELVPIPHEERCQCRETVSHQPCSSSSRFSSAPDSSTAPRSFDASSSVTSPSDSRPSSSASCPPRPLATRAFQSRDR